MPELELVNDVLSAYSYSYELALVAGSQSKVKAIDWSIEPFEGLIRTGISGKRTAPLPVLKFRSAHAEVSMALIALTLQKYI